MTFRDVRSYIYQSIGGATVLFVALWLLYKFHGR